ncbi:hypothetical protein HK096_009981, partial [Nowakowskiella sp. JEL0078]
MARIINFYHVQKAYGEFSNFYSAPIVIASVNFPTTEHYFQSEKFSFSPYHRDLVISAYSPGEAAKLGRMREFPMRPDWDSVRDDVMRVALRAKFTQHESLKELLIGTGDKKLVEKTQRDRYWGDGGNGSGLNMLGILLMELREELKKEELE